MTADLPHSLLLCDRHLNRSHLKAVFFEVLFFQDFGLSGLEFCSEVSS